MVDNAPSFGETQGETNHPWPGSFEGTGFRSKFMGNHLEEAIVSVGGGWHIVRGLKSAFEYPVEALNYDEEELYERAGIPHDKVQEIKSIIAEWNRDPEKYVNPHLEMAPEMKKIDPPNNNGDTTGLL
jgi:hypothetical protein